MIVYFYFMKLIKFLNIDGDFKVMMIFVVIYYFVR